MITWKNLDTLASYQELEKVARVNIAEAMTGENGAERVKNYSVPMAEGFAYNYAAKCVDDTVLAALAKLADEAQLADKFTAVYNGEMVNTGEQRLVLHHMTRGQLGDAVQADGVDKRSFYVQQQTKIAEFANKVHNGEITNAAGEKFTTVVQIGIGGSDLGPRAMYLALENWAKKMGTFKMEAKFISNVDPDDAAAVLNSIDVAHSIFVLVSKSGTTLETLTNESFVKDALNNAGLDASKHMIAVTSETSPLAQSDDYLAAFFMDDYIGGRYSSTSAVGGAVLSLAFGPDVFAQFLEGAAAEDKLATNQNTLENPSMLDALIGFYERNVLGFPSTAVLPYLQALSRFPAHLQQLDMESNGKSVNRFGEPINYVTGPVIFGEPGTNGQHSVSVIEMQNQVMAPLDLEMANLLHENMQMNQVELILEDGVSRFESHDDKTNVVLNSGKTVEVDIVILSIGVKPNSQLAVAAGLQTNERKGIVVDEQFCTSAEHIYAVGDVIGIDHFVTKEKTMIPLAGPANKQARMAADILCGDAKRYKGATGVSVAKVFDLNAQVFRSPKYLI